MAVWEARPKPNYNCSYGDDQQHPRPQRLGRGRSRRGLAIGYWLLAILFEPGGENGMKAIAAMTPSRVIGSGNTIPWKIPGEQKWFKEVTMGNCVLMGNKTYASIGKPLPGRRNLVVSRTRSWDGVEMIRDLSRFDPAQYQEEVYVIGGAEIYQQLIDRCDELLITQLNTEYAGDVYFPEYESRFSLAEKIRETPDYRIFRYVRRSAPMK
jgi:dihydrofolate reductase